MPMTICWRYRWSICTCMLDFVWWLWCASSIYSICQCLPCWCRSSIWNRVSPIQDLHIMRVISWTPGLSSSFEPLNFIQLIFCHSRSESGCLNLFRLFPLQISILKFCFSNLLVYLNCSTFSLSSVFFHSTPVFCFVGLLRISCCWPICGALMAHYDL